MWKVHKPICHYAEIRTFLCFSWTVWWVRMRHTITEEFRWQKIKFNELAYQLDLDELDRTFKKGIYADATS